MKHDPIEERLRAELPRLADAIADGYVADTTPARASRRRRRDAFGDPIDGPEHPRHRAAVLSGAAALVLATALVAVPLALRGDGDNPAAKKRRGPAVEVVAAAAGTTVGTGSYQVDFVRTSTKGTPSVAACPVDPGPAVTTVPEANGPGPYIELRPAVRIPSRGTPLRGIASADKISTDNGSSTTIDGGTVSTGGTTPAAPPPGCSPAKPATTTGVATIDVNPYAMRVVTHVDTLGDVTLLVGPDAIWEFGGAHYGVVGGDTPGAPLSKFASLVEGTLGRRDGALAMTSLANPNGYVDLTQKSIIDATPVGTGTVDGVAVDVYRVHTDRQAVVDDGLTADAATAIRDAVKVLEDEGYEGTTQDVSIDANGLIRRTKSVTTFADGGTVTNVNTFSKFGCAGEVALPGQPAPAPAEQQCWRPPSTAPASTTPPTTSATATTLPPDAIGATSTRPPATTVPAGPPPTTTGPPSTTSPVPPTTLPPTTTTPTAGPTTTAP